MTVIIEHDYDAAPADVWHVATDFACFLEAMKGIATFDGMPTQGRVKAGQSFDTKVRLFGRMPPMDYHMEVVACDDEAMRFESHEYGGSIKSWRHALQVTETPRGARLTDRIQIDAGLMTPLMRLWAKFVYNRRHQPRVQMLTAMERG